MGDEHDFGWALDKMRDGYRVRRAGWNGPGQATAVHVPDGRSKMTLPYLYLTNAAGDRVPWTPSQGDCLAYDWELAD